MRTDISGFSSLQPAKYTQPKAIKPNSKKPITTGVIVTLIKLPIDIAMTTEMTLLKKPMIAAPRPATCPSGTIANEFKLPNKIPTKKKLIKNRLTNNHNGGNPEKFKATTTNMTDMMTLPDNAKIHSFRMPRRITSAPLTNEAKPIEKAKIAKYKANKSPTR